MMMMIQKGEKSSGYVFMHAEDDDDEEICKNEDDDEKITNQTQGK